MLFLPTLHLTFSRSVVVRVSHFTHSLFPTVVHEQVAKEDIWALESGDKIGKDEAGGAWSMYGEECI
jgi:hypothetical protein